MPGCPIVGAARTGEGGGGLLVDRIALRAFSSCSVSAATSVPKRKETAFGFRVFVHEAVTWATAVADGVPEAQFADEKHTCSSSMVASRRGAGPLRPSSRGRVFGPDLGEWIASAAPESRRTSSSTGRRPLLREPGVASEAPGVSTMDATNRVILIPVAPDRVASPFTGATGPRTCFQRVARLLPEEQDVISAAPDDTVRRAFEVMGSSSFSQLPVMRREKVLGLFSYRSYSRGLIDAGTGKGSPLDLTVSEFVEPTVYVRATDDLAVVFRVFEHEEAVLVGQPDRLDGIITPVDVARYLHQSTRPFLLVEEIELGLRALVRASAGQHIIEACARKALSGVYRDPSKIPVLLEHMTLGDCAQIVTDGRNWADHFAKTFGPSRDRVRTRLEKARDLRNAVVHFRSLGDADTLGPRDVVRELETVKNWLFTRIEQLGPEKAEVVQ